MEKYRGQPTIVVNVATNCGLTKSNYKQLNEIYDKYEKDGLKIAAFSSNQFGQNPGCDVDIQEFIKKNNIRFDMYSNIDINGETDNSFNLSIWLTDNFFQVILLIHFKNGLKANKAAFLASTVSSGTLPSFSLTKMASQ